MINDLLFNIPIKLNILFLRLITLWLDKCSSKYISHSTMCQKSLTEICTSHICQDFRARFLHLLSSYEDIRCYFSVVNVIRCRFNRFVLSYLSTTVWNIVVILQVLCPFSVWKLSICQNWRHVTVFCKLCCFSISHQRYITHKSEFYEAFL